MVEYPDAIGFHRFQSGLDPLLQGLAVGNNALPAAGLVACPQTWGVTEITLNCGGRTSTSFSDRGAATVTAGMGAAGRFWFLPKEDDVRVAWKLKNPDNAKEVTLALYRAGSGLPIWQRTLDTPDTKKEQLEGDWDGSWPAGEWISADFPNHLLTTRHSPYMLKITAEDGPETGFVERWTYFDVLVHSIVLRWGAPNWLPAARMDLAALYSANTLQCETDILADVTLQSPGGGVVDAGARHLLRLHCDQFTQATAEMSGNPLFNRHREQWGNGTRIPLDAEVLLMRADGSGCSDAAVGPVLHDQRFLWDWESEDEVALIARHPSPAVQAYLTDSLDYHRNDGTGPPDSTNCHVDHGGKRGPGSTVFQPPAAAVVGPYGLVPAATRAWATFTRAKTAGADVCHTGVLFQPSRMAGDTYKVSVYLAAEPGLDCVAAAPTLRADHPGLPQASTGMFEVVRLIHCAYLRKAAAVTAAALGATTAEYRQAGVELDWLAGIAHTNEEARLRNTYDATVRLALDPAGALIDPATGLASVAYKAMARNVARVVSRAFDGIHQLDGNDGTGAGVVQSFVMWDWAAFQGRMRAAATRDYMINKVRRFNGPHNAYNNWRVLNPAPADDTAYLLGYYNGLSAKKKTKVNLLQTALMADPAMPQNAVTYRAKLKVVVQQLMKVVLQQFIIGGTAHRMTCIHSEDQYAMKPAAGALVEQYTDAGGFAPSDATAERGRRSMNLIWVPTVISLARLAAPTYHTPAPQVIKHEIGHNFYLVHASAALAANSGPSANDDMHDAADMLCLMNYDAASDHLCGYCNLRLRGWATDVVPAAAGVAGATVVLSNLAATNRVAP